MAQVVGCFEALDDFELFGEEGLHVFGFDLEFGGAVRLALGIEVGLWVFDDVFVCVEVPFRRFRVGPICSQIRCIAGQFLLWHVGWAGSRRLYLEAPPVADTLDIEAFPEDTDLPPRVPIRGYNDFFTIDNIVFQRLTFEQRVYAEA